MNSATKLLAWVGERVGKPPGWERIVRFFVSPGRLHGEADILVERDGMCLRLQPGVPLGWNLLMFGSYEPELRRWMQLFVTSGCVVVDVGANVGWHTLLLAKLVGSEGTVFAAEPNPSVRQRLEQNIRFNGFRNIRISPHVLAEAKGCVDFVAPDVSHDAAGDGHVADATEAGGVGRVSLETRTLDDWMTDADVQRLDFIKIDVEGYEWPVLQGALGSISRFRPIVIFEWDAAYSSRGKATSENIGTFFRDLEYELFKVGRIGATALMSSVWPACTDILAVPKARRNNLP